MSESLPGTMSVFATAYQNMLGSQGKGGGLTGGAATAALIEAVESGKVFPREIMSFVATEMEKRAAPKLDVARETSQSWQGRLNNRKTLWTEIASESGVEEGQRNFFRFFTQWMNENQQIPQRFGEMWKNISEQFAIAGGFGSLLRETLGGRDTIIKEWLGEEKTAQFAQDFERLSSAAKGAAAFLGLMGVEDKGNATVWEKIATKSAALAGVPGALLEGDLPRAGENLTTLFEGGGDAYLKRMPHLRAIQGVYNFAANPERDDEGYALAYLKMIDRQATYHPRGAELLMMGQQPTQSSAPPLVIENITLNANSGDREDLTQLMTDVLQDSYERAMQGLNR